MKPRIAVIGGGITGVFAAYFLARLGVAVTIVERGEIGGQASGSNAGGLNPLHGPGIPGPMLELALGSLALHRETWHELRRLTDCDFGARVVPRLHVAMDDQEAAVLAAARELHDRTPGFSARWLEGCELRRAEPRLGPQAVAGLWTEGNARVDPGAYTRAVGEAAVKLGARAVRDEVRGLHHTGGRVTALALASGKLVCDGVVMAPGPWCEEPARWLGMPLPVEPLKGELLLAELSTRGSDAEITWAGFGVYVAPERRVWLGGTEERAGYDVAPSGSARARILEGVGRLLPGLAVARIVRQVAGLRPVTPDGRPIVGIPSGWENVCVAVGAGRKGILLGVGLGLAAAELLTRGDTRMPIGACLVGRPELSA